MEAEGRKAEFSAEKIKPDERLTLTAVIPTRNRPDDLALTVRTLLGQTRLPLELIIVDQSAGDESELRIGELFARANHLLPAGLPPAVQPKLLYIRDERISGLTAARNVGLARCHGEIVLFLDDDVELEAEFVENLLASYAREPLVTGVSGIITNYARPTGLSRLWKVLFERGPLVDDRQPVYYRANLLRGAAPIPVSRFGGGMMSFRMEAIRGILFDENLTGSCEGEDVDFSLRLPKGARLVIDPAARLVHNSSPVGRAAEHWIRPVLRGNTYLYYRHWRSGLKNRLCFGWFVAGYALLAIVSGARRRTMAPWRAFRDALREGRERGTARPR